MTGRRTFGAMRFLWVLAATLCLAPSARALEVGRHRFDPGGKIRGARALDLNADGRADVVLLLEPREGAGGAPSLLVLLSPPTPGERTFFPAGGGLSLALAGDLAGVGAVALGRFGPRGAARLRLFSADGVVDVAPDGTRDPAPARARTATLLARSPGRLPVWWDGVADLDGDGRDECWVPTPESGGGLRVLGATGAQDRRLDLSVGSSASTSGEHVLERKAYVPTLRAVDLDGDGRRELVTLREQSLVAWAWSSAERPSAPADDAPEAPSFTLALPFLAPPADQGPEDVRTPRLQLEDADGDGKADLLLTMVTGRRDQLGGLRTTLYYFPGPLRDPLSGALRQPEGRIDTESVVLHPRFVDVDGDGGLDYVTDSIRGTRGDLIKRVMGAEPKITLVGFRLDRASRRFVPEPLFSIERPYATQQALSNQFGQSAWFEADLDGDGLKDLLDLGNLGGVEVLGATRRTAGAVGEPLQYTAPLVERIAVKRGLAPGALYADLTGDGRADVVLWNEDELFVLTTRGSR